MGWVTEVESLATLKINVNKNWVVRWRVSIKLPRSNNKNYRKIKLIFFSYGEQEQILSKRDKKGTAIIFILRTPLSESVLLLTFVTTDKSKCPPHRWAPHKSIVKHKGGKNPFNKIKNRHFLCLLFYTYISGAFYSYFSIICSKISAAS